MEQIVVVDDNADMRGYLGDFLTSAGYRVHEAANGSTVMEWLERNPVDLVITDVVMPIKEGIETICDVRRLFPAIKIIAISGYGHYLVLAGKLGADRVLAKPFGIKELSAAIDVLLHSERPAHRNGGSAGALHTMDDWRETT